MKKKKMIAGILTATLFLLCGLLYYFVGNPQKESSSSGVMSFFSQSETGSTTEEEPFLENTEESVFISEAALWYVQVSGAVNAPGVYEVAAGSRVFQAILLAGGLRADAAEAAINQADFLSDGQQIYVPFVGEESGQGSEELQTQSDGRININRASREELMTLPGIGESKADAIIAYRDSHGAFGSIEDIQNVPGIKSGLFEKIKERIKIA